MHARLLLILFLVSLAPAQTSFLAQGTTDVEELGDASVWLVEEVGLGVRWKRRRFESLFGSPQSLSVLEVELGRRDVHLALAAPGERRLTSRMAADAGSLAAVNGGYFDPKTGEPVGLLRIASVLLSPAPSGGQAAFGVDKRERLRIGPAPAGDWPQMVDALGAGPIVLARGHVVDHGPEQRKVRHPRTAIGVTKERRVVLAVVDGRTPQAAGMTFEELGAMMRELGCVDALNLDGGGSSAMWIAGRGDDGIVSFPCDNRQYDHAGERKVANAVLVHATAVRIVDNPAARLEPPEGWQLLSDGRDVFGADYAWCPDGRGRQATFALTLPRKGTWKLWLRWPKLAGTRAGRTRVSTGSEPKEWDQRLRAGRWVEAGTVETDAEARVELVLTGVAGRPMAVDAVRLVALAGR